MRIDNGERQRLTIAGVFDGLAGVSGSYVSYVPNLRRSNPLSVKGGVLDSKPVLLEPVKDKDGPFWTARFEVVE